MNPLEPISHLDISGEPDLNLPARCLV